MGVLLIQKDSGVVSYEMHVGLGFQNIPFMSETALIICFCFTRVFRLKFSVLFCSFSSLSVLRCWQTKEIPQSSTYSRPGWRGWQQLFGCWQPTFSFYWYPTFKPSLAIAGCCCSDHYWSLDFWIEPSISRCEKPSFARLEPVWAVVLIVLGKWIKRDNWLESCN